MNPRTGVIATRADGRVGDRPCLTEVDRVVDLVHARVIATDRLHDGTDPAMLRSLVESVAPLLSAAQIDHAVTEVGNRLHGLGPLEVLMADPTVDEIMVNGPGPVWVERRGELVRTSVDVDDRLLQLLIERIIGPLGLRVDRTAPFVDARLADGSRVNVAVPPLAIDGPYLTIRRFRPAPFELEQFCSADIAALLAGFVRTRKSMIISGGTGSGKTSLLNALARHITPSERVITIEDAAELRLPGDHVVRLESRPANAEGVGAVSVRTLVRNALRMRPDRLIIGEVRGGEALDMMQAMNPTMRCVDSRPWS